MTVFYKKKGFSGYAEYFLHLVLKESTFLARGGSTSPPLIGDKSPKKSSVFFTPTHTFYWAKNYLRIWSKLLQLICGLTTKKYIFLVLLFPEQKMILEFGPETMRLSGDQGSNPYSNKTSNSTQRVTHRAHSWRIKGGGE